MLPTSSTPDLLPRPAWRSFTPAGFSRARDWRRGRHHRIHDGLQHLGASNSSRTHQCADIALISCRSDACGLRRTSQPDQAGCGCLCHRALADQPRPQHIYASSDGARYSHPTFSRHRIPTHIANRRGGGIGGPDTLALCPARSARSGSRPSPRNHSTPQPRGRWEPPG